jgi:enamine deaminase RidA (YjgF/YER057c/UK114 family)
MSRKLISSGSTFEEQAAYSRAVIDGNWIFVSGTTGFDYDKMTIAEDIVEQTEQCLKNISDTLQQAGSDLSEIVRVLYIVPEAAEFPKCWPVLRRYFKDIRPAATMISAGLADRRMKIEIQVTALRKQKQMDNPLD